MQLTWDAYAADIDYIHGNEVLTNIIISLFTDARAHADDVLPDGGADRRGWWGDTFSNRKIGSRLWLLSREKQLSSVLRRAQEYAAESLQWMVEENLVKSVEVVATNPSRGVLMLTVRPVLLSDADVPEYSFTAVLNSI